MLNPRGNLLRNWSGAIWEVSPVCVCMVKTELVSHEYIC